MHTPFGARIRRTTATWLGTLVPLILATPAASAATWYISPSGSDSNPGTQFQPFLTIKNGIKNASSGDTVILEAGDYTGPGDVDNDFGGKNITVTSLSGAPATIINCAGTASANHRGFYFHSNETNATVSDITIENGFEGAGIDGGGIDIESGSTVTVTGCTVTSCTCPSSLGGGGVFSHGVVKLTNDTFSGNSSADGAGGGVFCFTTGTVTNCLFENNTANNGGGGYFGAGTVTGCTFENNTAFTGGGAALCVDATNCTFSGNSGDLGGGFLLEGPLTLADCTITGNTASERGGGGLNDDMGGVTLMNCVISGNSAPFGGGFYNFYECIANMVNCLIDGNTATSSNGGGVENDAGTKFKVQFCTFSANEAPAAAAQGGALENDGTATLTDDIFWGDTAPTESEIGIGASYNPATTVTYCDIEGGLAGTGDINVDPLFLDLPANYHLAPASPCIGAGIAITGATTDLDGKTRSDPPTIGCYDGSPESLVSSVGLNPPSVASGQPSTGTVTLSTAAPAGGSTVSLTSSNSDATVPGTVVVAAGETSAQLQIATVPVPTSTSALITASVGSSRAFAILALRAPAAFPSSIAVNPTLVIGGEPTTATVTLVNPAPAAGVTATIEEIGSGVTVPATVTIAGGATSATFQITTTAVTASQSRTIIALVYGLKVSMALTVAPTFGPKPVGLAPNFLVSGQPTMATITLGAPAPAGGLTVTLGSNNPNATIPGSVTVAAGATAAQCQITTVPVPVAATVQITASANGVAASSSFTLRAPPAFPGSITVSPAPVIGGRSTTATVTLLKAAPTGGVPAALEAIESGLGFPSTITIPAGAKSASFQITTTPLASSKSYTIIAVVYGIRVSTALVINAPTLETNGVSLNPNTVTGGQPSTGIVTLIGPAPASGLSVSLSSSNTAVASSAATVTVLAGQRPRHSRSQRLRLQVRPM